MTNIDYEVGLIKAQCEALQRSVEELTKTVSELTTTVEKVDTQITTWKSTAAGAAAVMVPVFSAIGAVILWLGDNLMAIIKIKLGW